MNSTIYCNELAGITTPQTLKIEGSELFPISNTRVSSNG